jgi:hypothetical protein
MRLDIKFIVSFIWLVAISCAALAQNESSSSGNSSKPVVGGVGVAAPAGTPTFGASNGTEILRHRGPTGSPCLSVGGFARPHLVNPNLYDHVIAAVNKCPQRISMQICYYNSQDCVSVEIPGNERKEAILGAMPSVKYFRFEFREKF